VVRVSGNVSRKTPDPFTLSGYQHGGYGKKWLTIIDVIIIGTGAGGGT